jgi:hypothetical protein
MVEIQVMNYVGVRFMLRARMYRYVTVATGFCALSLQYFSPTITRKIKTRIYFLKGAVLNN